MTIQILNGLYYMLNIVIPTCISNYNMFIKNVHEMAILGHYAWPSSFVNTSKESMKFFNVHVPTSTYSIHFCLRQKLRSDLV